MTPNPTLLAFAEAAGSCTVLEHLKEKSWHVDDWESTLSAM